MKEIKESVTRGVTAELPLASCLRMAASRGALPAAARLKGGGGVAGCLAGDRST
jgi:hypothetical protein